MKEIEEKAGEYAAKTEEEYGFDMHPKTASFQGYIDGYKEGQSSPKIKPLEWEEYDNEWEADTSIGTYGIKLIDTRFKIYFISGIVAYRSCLDEAKKAAQENFNNVVKECLE